MNENNGRMFNESFCAFIADDEKTAWIMGATISR